VIRSIKRAGTSVSGFSRAKAALDKAIIQARASAASAAGEEEAPLVPWRLHDLRRTGASTLARLGFDTIAIDKLLAHQPAKLRGVAGVYQRYDFAEERARALDAWAEHVLVVARTIV
jgi:integrase